MDSTNKKQNDAHAVSLRELCEQLSISVATGRNWIKLGKLTPAYTKDRTSYFSQAYVTTLKNEITSGKNTALKKRRNKKYISGNAVYHSYVSEGCKAIETLENLLEIITDKKIALTPEISSYLIADCALHLFTKNDRADALFPQYLRGELSVGSYDRFIDDLLEDRERAMAFYTRYPMLFAVSYSYEADEDILGLLYISCKNLNQRKACGSYYTPTKIVKKLISHLPVQSGDKILDPCCGTGNFLLQLPETVHFSDVYGNDTDAMCVKITRLNMALKYPDADIDTICAHITEQNYLTEYKQSGFQYIIGNPPWGYAFSDLEKPFLKELYKTAAGRNIESYDVFMERSFSALAPDGQLSFILPEAILNVKAHTKIRSILLKKSSIHYLEFLGNAFDGVHCPCILLQLIYTKKPFSTVGMQVADATRAFTIETKRPVHADCFSFLTTDAEYQILKKIKHRPNCVYLSEHADFALGIVTGDNKNYITTEKTADNEMVLKGSDICKYHINETDHYLVFDPERFQQTAPAQLYRAPEKLLYRFICNQLVFAYDDRQTLSLNSCNLVIPKLEGLNIKYILAILNSRVAQFLYQKEFNSVKVLRSHIEMIPIPQASTAQQDVIISAVEPLIAGQEADAAAVYYEALDAMVFELYGLNAKEQQTVIDVLPNPYKFL